MKRMGAKGKQEDYQSKLARYMHNFHHRGGNGFNAYGRNNHGNGNFTPNMLELAETLKPSIIEEIPKVNELPQAQEVVEESIVLHGEEEAFKEEFCDNMNEKSIEKEEC
ncbi:hypothetical protein M9H77_02453 [Catharanthus roseus]|uniref:Uncharacterized protein n=1 Tax=Catharanthus roseus TaxID=4058 RepID=A0ACC0C8G7_CATRO|nr:hypothetical protein M9H77_02453 [Catharanthus roseus]